MVIRRLRFCHISRPHIANHLTAIWSTEFHKAVMNILRLIYRASLIQTALVGLFSIPDYRGMALLWRKIATPNGFIGSLQTASGAYLAAFVTLSSDGRLRARTMGDADRYELGFATGAPTGLMGDPWNVRLVPHYSLAVFLLFSHLACGLKSSSPESPCSGKRSKRDRPHRDCTRRHSRTRDHFGNARFACGSEVKPFGGRHHCRHRYP